MYLKRVIKILWVSCFIFFIFVYSAPCSQSMEEFYTTTSKSSFSNGKPSKVILGGDIIGFEYMGDGVLVLSNNRIATLGGYLENTSKGQLYSGDIICKVDDIEVSSAEQLSNILNKGEKQGQEVVLSIRRDDKSIEVQMLPVYDLFAKKYKLGVWVKDRVRGIGTLTYICPDTGRYGALGHPVTDETTGKVLGVKAGKVYNCNILGVSKGARGVPGELRGTISKRRSLGTVAKINDFGVYGEIESESLINSGKLVEVGGRKTAKPGPAQIHSSVDNGGEFDIRLYISRWTIF